MEGSISTGVCKKLNNVDSNNGMQISKKLLYKEIESTVDIHRRNTIYICVCICIYMCVFVYICTMYACISKLSYTYFKRSLFVNKHNKNKIINNK